MISRLIITAAIALFFTPAAMVLSQEHPEHPKKTTEQPKKGGEHPKTGGAEKGVSTADISAGSGGKYFACVDMKGTDGKTYDIDFFLTGQPGKMKVTETSVHKIDGKPLYDWKEENGTWHKVPAS